MDPEPEPLEPAPTDASGRDGFIVFGQVLLSNERPVEACTVRAFDRDLRSKQFLGETRADTRGSYRISYTKEQFERAEHGTADLVVRAYDPIGKLLAESDILFNASPQERIDLDVPQSASVQPSEYDRLVALLTPLLDGVSLPELTGDDVWFLTNETGRPIHEIAFLADDARLAPRTEMPEAVFFGLAMQEIGVLSDGATSVAGEMRLPQIDLPTVLDRDVNELVAAVQAALEKLIPTALNYEIETIRRRFNDLKAHRPES